MLTRFLHRPRRQVRNGRLRADGKHRLIGIGRTRARPHAKLLIQDRDVTVIKAVTGEVLRELTMGLGKDYQPTVYPRGPTRTK